MKKTIVSYKVIMNDALFLYLLFLDNNLISIYLYIFKDEIKDGIKVERLVQRMKKNKEDQIW